MKMYVFIVLFSVVLGVNAQVITSVTLLEPLLNETSGVLFVNQKIITHNDSYNGAALFEIDTLTGTVDRTVIIGNASNVDWEDLAMDSNFIYIGDFGNNDGNRTNLRIYKVSLTDYWNTTNDTIFADTLQFHFANQTDFSSQTYVTNFDCEAMTVIGDSIYLFTKNWGNLKTTLYRLPKVQGNYALFPVDSLAVQGLITSADFNSSNNRLVLLGNTPINPFLVTVDWNPTLSISNMPFQRSIFDAPNSIQVESISTISQYEYYLTAETLAGSSADLFRLNTSNLVLEADLPSKQPIIVYPNPASNIVYFSESVGFQKDIFTPTGQWLATTLENEIDINNWKEGVYIVKIRTPEGDTMCKVCKYK